MRNYYFSILVKMNEQRWTTTKTTDKPNQLTVNSVIVTDLIQLDDDNDDG